MSTKAAVSYSTEHDSYNAGREMSLKALADARLDKCQFSFAFASSEHDAEKLIKGIKSVLGEETLILGGTSAGIITGDYMGYEGFHAGILVISSDEISIDTHLVEGLKDGEYDTGRKMGEKISRINELENPNLLLFYDSMQYDRSKANPFYQATPILAGIQSVLNDWPPVAGVGIVGGAMGTKRTELWNNDKISKDSILSVLISGSIRMDTTIMHGLKPASDYHTITKATGNILFEFDGRPAMEVASEYLGFIVEPDWKNAMYLITIGVNRGEKYDPFREENYINRLVLGVDETSGALLVMEGDLKVGDNFQFMRRSIETDMVSEMAQKLMESIGTREPLFAFYIACLGRVKKFFGTEKEESEEIQKTIGSKMPLLGIYSGTEIARVRDNVMPLDWTGVLCIFSSK
ncbi:MAG: hypothetical protein E4G95_01570 [Bacteroidia bacterium]|nr:MAG: hypothetical protein E4G95_01570 [Bacteroidia bacterium]